MSEPDDTAILMYRRPGCPYCVTLSAGLRLRGVPFRTVDIWQDPDAAAFVRSHARGHETVPTVAIGDTVLVNPSARQVIAHLDAQATSNS
jgi:glutaredoxin-like protein